jgi:adenylate cyclase
MTRAERATRWALVLIGLAPLAPTLIGSAVNIWYNLVEIDPLLTEAQRRIFVDTTARFNIFVYPPAFAVWVWIVWSLRAPFRALTRGEPVDRERLARARRRVINLPWWVVVVCGTGWALCIPVFLYRLQAGAEPLHVMVYAHLPISFAISGMIATTHGFFGVELLSQRLLYPVFFHDAPAWRTPGGHALSLRERGLLWALSAGVCPIVSLVMLAVVPKTVEAPGFALAVGAIGVLFGLVTAWLVGRLVTEPIDDLTGAALSVSKGDLGIKIERTRADEFGPLIDAFNTMVGGLREKVRIEENFGRHVGQAVARQIMERPEGLGGAEQEITVLFLDIRGFTARAANAPPAAIVGLLNAFFAEMVEVIERRHGGIVNKFLGDGLMAIFGDWTGRADHADAAFGAATDMLVALSAFNARLTAQGEAPLRVGIGVHTGAAVVGSIGSPHRMEYTAIGDAVNVASRVEGVAALLGEQLLVTAATRAALHGDVALEALPPQQVKGQRDPVAIFRPVAPGNRAAEAREPRPAAVPRQ